MGTHSLIYSLFFFFLGVTAHAGNQAASCASTVQAQVQTEKLTAIAVIDALSSGSLLPPAITKRGITPIHILSGEKFDASLRNSIHLEDFAENDRIVFDGNVEKLKAELKKRNVGAVIVGCETGVQLADLISESMELRTNGTGLSHARRDKYWMQKVLADLGVPVASQFHASDLGEILRRLPEVGYPTVIKPRDAAAGFKVAIESTPEGVARAFNSLIGQMNPVTGNLIDSVLVQSFLAGDEYVVDSVSRDGVVYFTDISKYHKVPFNGSPVVYERETLVPLEVAERLGLLAYARRVLAGLQINNGAAHMELKLTPQGPRLVEVGARLSGGGFPVLVEAATGESPVEAVLDAYDPSSTAFFARMQRPRKLKPATVLYLMTTKTGTYRGIKYLDQIKALPSYLRDKMNVHDGEKLGPTTNFLDYPGQIELVHDDPTVVERDAQQIRKWEAQDDFYVLDP